MEEHQTALAIGTHSNQLGVKAVAVQHVMGEGAEEEVTLVDEGAFLEGLYCMLWDWVEC